MKRASFPAFALLLACLCVGTVQAEEIYWDLNESRAADVLGLDQDFDITHDWRVATPSGVQIYDSRDEDLVAVDMPGEETEEPAVRPLRQTTPSTVRQRPADSTQAPSRIRRQTTPDTAGTTDTQQKATGKELKKKRSTPGPATVTDTEKPESQREKPGEVDVKPVEPKSKLQWGR